jgi:hypothetical protein
MLLGHLTLLYELEKYLRGQNDSSESKNVLKIVSILRGIYAVISNKLLKEKFIKMIVRVMEKELEK